MCWMLMYLSNFVSVHQVQQQKYLFAITDWQWEQNVTSCQAARKAQAYWAGYLWLMSIYNISKNMTRRKTRNNKAWYAVATKSVSTRSTLLKVDCCRIPYTFSCVAGFGNKSATTWIQHLVAVDFVADTVDFVVFGAKAKRSTFSNTLYT